MTDAMLGAIFANLSADEQANFLNGAGKMLRRGCEDSFAMDTQACLIVDCLDGNGRDLVKKLAAFIEHDEQTPQIVKQVKVVPEGATFMEVPEGLCGKPIGLHDSGRVFLCTLGPDHFGDCGNAEHSVGCCS